MTVETKVPYLEGKMLCRLERFASCFQEVYKVTTWYTDGSVEEREELGQVHFYDIIGIF